jgi:putative redox protein
VTGKELKDAAVSRAVDLSAEKYCSVALMLEKAVKITHSYEVVVMPMALRYRLRIDA